MQCICNEGHLFIQSTFDRSRLKREILIQKLTHAHGQLFVKFCPACSNNSVVTALSGQSLTLARPYSLESFPLLSPHSGAACSHQTQKLGPFLHYSSRSCSPTETTSSTVMTMHAKRSPLNETHVADLVLSARLGDD